MAEGGIKPEREIDLLDVRGRSNEALQAIRSHEQMDNLRFGNMDEKLRELKDTVEDKGTEVTKQIAELRVAMDAGFSNTDKKFWSLAITIIMLLLTVTGFLFVRTMFPHG